MKIVFCGPPHSGKSVFIDNLSDNLPTDAYTIIRACPDGEGTWSNNKNQKETTIVRKKGKLTKTFIEDSCKAIDNQTNKIVLVDVGGVMSKENEQVFGHCDSFIVLSSDEEKKKQWLEFGQNLGLECIGCLDSSLEGKEEIYSRVPYLQGNIVGLERGKILEDSSVIKGIVSDIIEKSKYSEKDLNNEQLFNGTMIDDTEFGFELGYGKELYTETGIPMKKVKWSEEAIPQVYQKIQEKVSQNKQVRINGIRPNFMLPAIYKACKQQGVTDISTYDMRSKQYIPIKTLPKKKWLKETEGLSYNIIENKENIFMDMVITKEQYSLDDYDKCVLPQIKEEKNLYLSGRIPLWLLASISGSYNSSRIFTFQPGKGFTCIYSIDEKDLGKIVDVVDGIDTNKYFEDKNENTKAKLPATIEKQGMLFKIKRLFANIKENRNKSKYLDSTIKAKNIDTIEQQGNKKTFQRELKQDIKGQKTILGNTATQEMPETQISKLDVGG